MALEGKNIVSVASILFGIITVSWEQIYIIKVALV